MGKHVVKTYEGQRVDKETGEILEYTKSVEVIKQDLEPFFLTYSKQIISLYSSAVFNATTKVLWKLMEYAEYNTGVVLINSRRRDEIVRMCGISKTSFYRSIDELENIGIITKDKGAYIITENMFWKGDRKAREELKNAKLKVSFVSVFEDEEKKEKEQAHKQKRNGSNAC